MREEETLLGDLLERWGTPATLELPQGESLTLPVILQPVQDRSKQYLEDSAGTFGRLEQSRCICWAKADAAGLALEEGVAIRVAGSRWVCRRREVFLLRGAPYYLWAVLHQGEEDLP